MCREILISWAFCIYKWYLSLSEPVPFSGDRREIAFWWWNQIFQFLSQDCSFYGHTAQIKSHLTISPGPFCHSSVPFYTNNCYNMLPCNCFSLQVKVLELWFNFLPSHLQFGTEIITVFAVVSTVPANGEETNGSQTFSLLLWVFIM